MSAVFIVTLRMICYIENDLSPIKRIFVDIFVTYQKNIRGYFCHLSKKYSGIFLLPIKKIFGDIPLRVTVTHLHPFAGRFTPHLKDRL